MPTGYQPGVYREQGGNKLIVKGASGEIKFTGQVSVTQATDRATAVTCNSLSGRITTDDASLAGVTIVKHTVNNNRVVATDTVIVSKVSGDADTSIWVDAVAAGSFVVALRNNHASAADTTALVYNFNVIKAEG